VFVLLVNALSFSIIYSVVKMLLVSRLVSLRRELLDLDVLQSINGGCANDETLKRIIKKLLEALTN